MDLQTIIIGLMSLALGIVPVLYLQGKSQKEKKALHKSFIALATNHNLTITKHDFWGPNYAIGIDEVQQKLLYSKNKGHDEEFKIIDLINIKNSTVVNNTRDFNGNRIFDSIVLTFNHINHQTVTPLEFYSKDSSLNLNDELLIAEKWKSIVNSVVTTRNS